MPSFGLNGSRRTITAANYGEPILGLGWKLFLGLTWKVFIGLGWRSFPD
jgi:hypothetical protein